MKNLFNDEVLVLRAGLTDTAYGKKRDWAHASVVFKGLGNVQPDRSFEVRSPERETAQERILVYLPIGADVGSADRLRCGSQLYEVDGVPSPWEHGSLRHVRVRAWRVEH
ncbi:hypothetical protein OS965_37920 [Streptomyces sp. H27-G5]|uniref:hypothetical protein n=1 Tax=Streptomyces sp. H27-G5 TaxID=2996698 RepID=UPI00226EB2D2|nr:hypothetical protein [Streptomyces sp. H27-G5]MCY0923845.1 hypothetical protein [Streptomyces sp. H27-G5]